MFLRYIDPRPLGFGFIKAGDQFWDPKALTWGVFAATLVTPLVASQVPGHEMIQTVTVTVPAGSDVSVVIYDLSDPAHPRPIMLDWAGQPLGAIGISG